MTKQEKQAALRRYFLDRILPDVIAAAKREKTKRELEGRKFIKRTLPMIGMTEEEFNMEVMRIDREMIMV